MKKYLLLALLPLGVMIMSCNQNKKTASDLLVDSLLVKQDSSGISEQDILVIVTSIPNPVEMSMLLQKARVKYSASVLNPAENLNKYSTNYKKALNMGVYGTDLVHMNIYDRTTSALQYLNNIQSLAKDLGVEKFFDAETLNRLSENSKNVDSVLFITSSGFDQMNQFLQKNNRTSISVLIGTGTWIESLYIATNCDNIGDKNKVYERIGDQKYVIENIVMMLEKYKSDVSIGQLYKDVVSLKKKLDKVQIVIEYAAPTTEIVNGMPVTTDNSKSVVKMNDQLFKEISLEAKRVRNAVIG